MVRRIDAAQPAISVISIAEERSGEISASWGPALTAQAETRRRSYVRIPIDPQIIERWAQLDAECRRQGLTGADDNDLWIAATAIEHTLVLVTCDKAQSELPGLRSPIYLPAPR